MKSRFLFAFIVIFFLACFHHATAQSKLENFLGTWKGTSLCQVKGSPCHDEVVVYYITKGNSADSCYIRADKIVNGVEEDMGILGCQFDKEKNQIVCFMNNSIWSFRINGDKLKGDLFVRNNLYRLIEVTKVK